MIRRKILDGLRGSVRIKRHLKTPPVPHFSRPSSSSEAKVEVGLFFILNRPITIPHRIQKWMYYVQ